MLMCAVPALAWAQGTPAPAGLGAAKPAGQTQTQTPGQDAGAATTLSVSANLVNLPVLVRDKKGAIVQNLNKADFTLQVDGKPQTIRYFDLDRNLPLTLGLLVDTSGSQRGVVDQEQQASSTFLDQMLNPASTGAGAAPRTQDRAFLLQFAREVELLQDLTDSRPKLQEAIKEIGTPNPNARSADDDNNGNDNSGNGGNGRSGNARRGGTALYDAVFLAANEVMAKQKGRKAIVILSDGVDRNSKESMNRAIEEAQRADVVVYAIYFKGQEEHQNYGNNGGFPGGRGGGWPGGGGGYPGGGYPGGGRRGGQQPSQLPAVDGKKVLEKMAGETGGRMFEAKGGEKGVVDIYNQIGEELRAQYRLGFTPEKEALADGYHRVDLETPNQKNMRIQTRDGYYTGAD